MHMLGHDDVADQLETIFFSDLAENLDEQVPVPRRAKKRKTVITTESEKVQVTESVDTLEVFRHRRKAKSPTLPNRAWGTRNSILSS